jgi:hypothetical protein
MIEDGIDEQYLHKSGTLFQLYIIMAHLKIERQALGYKRLFYQKGPLHVLEFVARRSARKISSITFRTIFD